jgi:hypothetical protein
MLNQIQNTNFNPKKLFLCFRKYDPAGSSFILILVMDPDSIPIPYPGVNKAPDPGSESATLVFIKKGISKKSFEKK